MVVWKKNKSFLLSLNFANSESQRPFCFLTCSCIIRVYVHWSCEPDICFVSLTSLSQSKKVTKKTFCIWSAWVLKPITELCRTVRVLIEMCSRQLLQGGGTYTAHTGVVHIGIFGSVWTLCGCIDMPCLLQASWWQSFISYLMEVLSGFPLSTHLFRKHLFIWFALQRYMFIFVSFKAKFIW